MTTPEGRRLDLYNVLVQRLGQESTDTLMSYLPASPAADLATQGDIAMLADRFDSFEGRMDRFERRLDQMIFALAATLLAIVTAFGVQIIFGP